MSGGTTSRIHYQISEDIDLIEHHINQEEWASLDDTYYSDKVINQLKQSVNLIKQAQIHLHRIDCLLSGDDSEESFINRLNEDLQKLKQEFDDKLPKEGFTE